MSENEKFNSKTRLGNAIHDAAMANINEDLKGIYDTLDKILIELPNRVNTHTAELKADILSLQQALKSVPDTFDVDFSRKMNRILDVLNEVDSHSTKLNKILQQEHSEQLVKTANNYAAEFNKKIADYGKIGHFALIIYGLFSALLGGFIGGVTLWLMFKFT
ncbi:hypothetical protein [Shewanella septentrionalis]|uniref:Uncharacterized protein n=1 Tax=Shewanella septentrionalis TaxID=2952223 RepID=A0A9X2WYG7_9GAMM|nr:hypothetical protein [Shewanella septentrionalis]MCT7947708.1 hypothetical protein [Shewanella septentrionalis]